MKQLSLFISKANQGKPKYHSNTRLCPTTNEEEAEDEQFYEDLQDLPELNPHQDVLFIIGLE